MTFGKTQTQLLGWCQWPVTLSPGSGSDSAAPAQPDLILREDPGAASETGLTQKHGRQEARAAATLPGKRRTGQEICFALCFTLLQGTCQAAAILGRRGKPPRSGVSCLGSLPLKGQLESTGERKGLGEASHPAEGLLDTFRHIQRTLPGSLLQPKPAHCCMSTFLTYFQAAPPF